MTHDEAIFERLMRIETRLAQLMKYLGAEISLPNKQGEFFTKLENFTNSRRITHGTYD